MAIHPNSPQKPNYSSKMPFKLPSRTSIQISLAGGKGEKSSYSTLDAIKGTVDVSVRNATAFTEIEVALTGTSTTLVDAAGRSGALVGGESQATQQFLKLTQPIDLNQLDLTGNVLRQGTEYNIPFTFVVPTHLLPRACAHRSTSAAVRDAHLKLPPTLGDKKTPLGFMTTPDFSPEGVKVEYSISINIFDGTKTVAKETKKIRIVPAVEEEPPVSVEDLPGQYVNRKEKTVRKSLFGGKVGRMAAYAPQPPSFKLPATDCVDYDPTTFARISLRFDPANANASPPSLSALNSKLMVTTAWATTPRTSIQHQGFFGKRSEFRDVTSDALTDEVPLSPLTLSSTTSLWTQHLPSDPRSSVVSTSSVLSDVAINGKDEIISPSKTSNPALPFYTTTLAVPLTLPLSKHTWLPTFHSCLISRTYALSLSIQFCTGSSSSRIELVVPVQLSQKHTARGEAAIEMANTQAQAAMEAEETFIARSTLAVQSSPSDIMRVGFPSVVGAIPMGVSHDMPPDYAGIEGTGNWNGRVMSDRRTWSRF